MIITEEFNRNKLKKIFKKLNLNEENIIYITNKKGARTLMVINVLEKFNINFDIFEFKKNFNEEDIKKFFYELEQNKKKIKVIISYINISKFKNIIKNFISNEQYFNFFKNIVIVEPSKKKELFNK